MRLFTCKKCEKEKNKRKALLFAFGAIFFGLLTALAPLFAAGYIAGWFLLVWLSKVKE